MYVSFKVKCNNSLPILFSHNNIIANLYKYDKVKKSGKSIFHKYHYHRSCFENKNRKIQRFKQRQHTNPPFELLCMKSVEQSKVGTVLIFLKVLFPISLHETHKLDVLKSIKYPYHEYDQANFRIDRLFKSMTKSSKTVLLYF